MYSVLSIYSISFSLIFSKVCMPTGSRLSCLISIPYNRIQTLLAAKLEKNIDIAKRMGKKLYIITHNHILSFLFPPCNSHAKILHFFETTKQSGDFVAFHRAILQCFIGRFCNVLSGNFGVYVRLKFIQLSHHLIGNLPRYYYMIFSSLNAQHWGCGKVQLNSFIWVSRDRRYRVWSVCAPCLPRW